LEISLHFNKLPPLTQPENEGLKRVIGTRALIAATINLTIGAGIFALPADVAGYLGTASWMAYVACISLLMLMLLCFVSLGTKFTATGGAYVYVERAFGPYAGFLVNSLYWFGYAVMAVAAVANLLVDSVSVFLPLLKTPVGRISAMALVFGFICWINVRGVKHGSRLIEINTVAKLLPLFVLIVAGCFMINTDNYAWNGFPPITQLGSVSLLLFFAFGGGAETVINASGEVRNPRKTIPMGLLVGAFLVFLIYLSIHLVAQGVLGSDLALYKDAPLAKVAEQAIGPFGVTLLVAGAAISCFGLVSGDLLASPRLLFAAARDGMLPKFLAKVHPQYATPYWAVIVYAGIGFLLSVSGGFRELATLASSALLLIYVGVIFAQIKLRKVNTENSFNIPGGLLVPILALAATLCFLSNLAWKEIISTTVFLLVLSIIYLGMKFSFKHKS
jgi:basic amino acid/polyamine antiporter, APA family